MKFGILTFGYEGFIGFRDSLHNHGHYTVNLGDNTQSIAIRHTYRQLGVGDADIVDINRDTLATYDGEPAMLIMNGVFLDDSFPISEKITPVFVGFHANADVMARNLAYFKRHEPIGCRDPATADALADMGVAAHVTGCLTLSLPPRARTPDNGRLLIVYGQMAGRIPPEVLKFIPPDLADTAEFVAHRLPVFQFPLPADGFRNVERYEQFLLDRYASEAAVVLTSLHHVAAPCLAMGIPVIIARIDNDKRFGLLGSMVPVYTPDRFAGIDWRPQPVAIEPVRQQLLDAARLGVERALAWNNAA